MAPVRPSAAAIIRLLPYVAGACRVLSIAHDARPLLDDLEGDRHGHGAAEAIDRDVDGLAGAPVLERVEQGGPGRGRAPVDAEDAVVYELHCAVVMRIRPSPPVGSS